MDQQKLLQKIENAVRNKERTLDLRSNQLNELSPEIGQLTNLTELDLSNTQLHELPLEIGQLTNLTALYLRNTQLRELPPEIGQLTNLTAINLSNTQLSELPPEIGQLTSLTAINLSNTQLRELPPEIGQLTNLTAINLSNTPMHELPPEIGQLTSLTVLTLRNTRLSELSPMIGRLTSLTTLALNNMQMHELPPMIGQLTSLIALDLSDTQLRQLPPEIDQLASLIELDLSNTQLRELPSEIGQLTSLTALYLSNTQLRELPSEIGQLTSLTMLDLSNTQLHDLPPEIGQLTSLTVLDLRNTQLRELPLEIGQLITLAELDLRDTQLHELPLEIGQLTSLKALYLRNTQLRELPLEIGQLTNLTMLDLNNTQLHELPPEICQLVNLLRISVRENPLISPPLEIASRGVEAMRSYFASLENESQILNEVKILLVGEGNAGKTSLTRRVLGEDFNQNEPTTHGIRINSWQIETNDKQIKANIWDFGGQEVMHATHQFFLSKRSLYVLVLDGRRDERPEYWLRHIESFGGDSPILIVLNKHDANPGFDINRPFLQRKYPNIKGVFRTSCSTDYGVEDFRAALTNELSQVKLLETRWANSWFQVKQQLENLEDPYISFDRYETICTDAEITESISQDVLVDFLNDLGVIVHFKDFELDDTHVLEPKWVTTAVYKIINSEKVAVSNGMLQLKDLKEILKKQNINDYFYPRSKYKYIVGLMQKFELCYHLNTETVLIPQLLSIREPDFAFDYDTSLKFVLNYDDFLPLSVMPRFIVKRHQDIKGELRWRTGVVLENRSFRATAVIRVDNEAHCISIYVNGTQKKDYLAVILLFFREINDSFEKLKVSERVPMPDNPDITASYKTLQNYTRRGLNDYIPDGSDKVYKVDELLGQVQLDATDDGRQILEILQRLEDKMVDKAAFMESANRIIDLKPNIAGIGVNLNALFEALYDTYRNRQTPQLPDYD